MPNRTTEGKPVVTYNEHLFVSATKTTFGILIMTSGTMPNSLTTKTILMRAIHCTTILFTLTLLACSSTPPSPTTSNSEPITNQSTASRSNQVAASSLRTSEGCISIIKKYEGVELTAYKGLGGHWLIGYGHNAGIQKGMTISMKKSEKYLRTDLIQFEKDVARLVTVPVTHNEFSAMVCLTYNIGSGNFAKSTVLREVNNGNTALAADAFLMWNKANGKVLPQLKRRRESDKALFLSQ